MFLPLDSVFYLFMSFYYFYGSISSVEGVLSTKHPTKLPSAAEPIEDVHFFQTWLMCYVSRCYILSVICGHSGELCSLSIFSGVIWPLQRRQSLNHVCCVVWGNCSHGYLHRWCHASSLYMHNTHMHGLMCSFSSKDAEIYLVHLYKGPEHVPHWSTIQSMHSSNIMECDLCFLMNLIVWSIFLLSWAVDLWLLPISHSNNSQFSSGFSAVFTFNVSIRTSKQ